MSTPHFLHAMISVSDLDRSIIFYRDLLGMHEFKRETFTKGRFMLVFIGYGGGEASDAVIELTHNWDENDYECGTGFGRMALEVADIYVTYSHLIKLGIEVVREPGPMLFAADESQERDVIAFIKDPDGYWIELVESK